MLETKQWQSLRGFPARLGLGYLVVCSLYIALSDRLVGWVWQDSAQLTRIQSIKGWAFVTVSAALIFLVCRHFVRSIERVQASLDVARLDYRRLLETTQEGVLITDGSGCPVFVNDRLCSLAGVERARLLQDGLRGLAADQPDEAVGAARDELKLVRPDGREVWVIVSESEIPGRDGRPNGILRMFTDNTARRLAANELASSLEMQRLLLAELDHRVRNNLASLVGLIDLSAGENPERERFARKVTGRIRVMASAYSLLSEARWHPVGLAAILAEVTGPAEERRSLEGPAVSVDLDQVVPLMLVLHELFTNAQEHGALRRAEGRLDVRWRITGAGGEATTIIDWVERGGPPIEQPPQSGFGLDVAKGIAASELRGGLEYAFTRDGVRLTLRLTSVGSGGWRTTREGKTPSPAAGRW
jgi:PAS domain S-box-containing protein